MVLPDLKMKFRDKLFGIWDISGQRYVEFGTFRDKGGTLEQYLLKKKCILHDNIIAYRKLISNTAV